MLRMRRVYYVDVGRSQNYADFSHSSRGIPLFRSLSLPLTSLWPSLWTLSLPLSAEDPLGDRALASLEHAK